MTANTTSNQLVTNFKQLPVDDQIAALGIIYQQIGGSLPSIATAGAASKQVEDIVKHVLEMREGGQIQFLQDVLTDTDQDEVVLDVNPSKAMVELIPGDGIEPPIEEYEDLSANERLMVWYQLAGKMGDKFISFPSDYQPSDTAKEILNSLGSLSVEEKLQFLSQVV